MKSRQRSQAASTAGVQPAGTAMGPGRGNQAAQEELRGDGQHESEQVTEHLGYRVLQTDDGPRDPEAIDGVLPFLEEGGWDTNLILNHLTQLDSDVDTLVDDNRCAAVATLAMHLQSGPGQVAKLAVDTAARLAEKLAVPEEESELWPRVREAMTAQLQTLAALPARLTTGIATYQDLRRLSDAMKLVTNSDPTRGTNAESYQTMVELGQADGAWVGENHSGWAPAQELIASLQQAEAPLGYVLSVGTNDFQPNRTNHAVNLGRDAAGQVYLFDPWPKDGDQRMVVGQDDAAILPYFQTTAGYDRVWRVRTRMATP